MTNDEKTPPQDAGGRLVPRDEKRLEMGTSPPPETRRAYRLTHYDRRLLRSLKIDPDR